MRTDYEALSELALAGRLDRFSEWDRRRDSACLLASVHLPSVGVVWVLLRNPTGEYEQAALVFARTMEGAWTLTPFISVSDWYEDAFERPDDEWENWGPVIDLSESFGHDVERRTEPSSHHHPQTQAWGFLAVTGIAARQIRSVRLQSSSGRETTVEVDGESGAFLAVVETLDGDDVLAVTGTTDSGETVHLD